MYMYERRRDGSYGMLHNGKVLSILIIYRTISIQLIPQVQF